MKTTIAAALLAIAGAAQAQTTVRLENFINATVQAAGNRSGFNGQRFWNIEGSGQVGFESYGAARWDLASVRTQFDAEFGVGNWRVTNVDLELTQSNASFTTDGDVDVYFTGNDTTTLTAGSSSEDNWPLDLNGPYSPLTLLTSYFFIEISTGTVETYNISNPAVFADIETDPAGLFTLVLNDASADVAATYAGYNSDVGDGPTLVITAEARSGNAPPGPFAIVTPTAEAFVAQANVAIDWEDAARADTYSYTVSLDEAGTAVIASGTTTTSEVSLAAADVLAGPSIYWVTVTASNAFGSVEASNAALRFALISNCPGDINFDGAKDIFDILAYFNSQFAVVCP